ncbi:hypothetical protein [uncultured Winogradskyella sp.]|uniref:hypothetical protein n=1 Tax=uncultured Winogradskyella sp. TaxID=395353 RepID=UPI002619F306|nr:hypothetical protein [uncultured Winogradskyella sp.]
MRLRLLILNILLFFNYSNGQDLDLTELKAPSSPAFTILGVQPTEIARPTTFDAFKANLFDNFSDENGFSIPQNLALEFSPYWLFNHKNLTFDKLLDPSLNSVWTNIARNSSISIATMDIENQIEDDMVSSGTRLGIGYRTLILSGSPSNKNKEKLQQALLALKEVRLTMVSAINVIQTLAFDPGYKDFDKFLEDIPSEIEKLFNSKGLNSTVKERIRQTVDKDIVAPLKKYNINSPLDTQSKLQTYINGTLVAQVLTKKKSDIQSKAKAVEDLVDINNNNYKGFFLEFATALTLDFNNNKFDNSSLPKWGFWLTPSYRTESEKFEFLGVLRFIKNEIIDNVESDNFDVGAKLVFEKDKLSFSGEFIKRFQYLELMDNSGNLESKDDLKAVLNIEYKLADNILITYTFGEDFNVNTESDGNVISTVGLSYNIGGSTKNIKLFE